MRKLLRGPKKLSRKEVKALREQGRQLGKKVEEDMRPTHDLRSLQHVRFKAA